MAARVVPGRTARTYQVPRVANVSLAETDPVLVTSGLATVAQAPPGRRTCTSSRTPDSAGSASHLQVAGLRCQTVEGADTTRTRARTPTVADALDEPAHAPALAAVTARHVPDPVGAVVQETEPVEPVVPVARVHHVDDPLGRNCRLTDAPGSGATSRDTVAVSRTEEP